MAEHFRRLEALGGWPVWGLAAKNAAAPRMSPPSRSVCIVSRVLDAAPGFVG